VDIVVSCDLLKCRVLTNFKATAWTVQRTPTKFRVCRKGNGRYTVSELNMSCSFMNLTSVLYVLQSLKICGVLSPPAEVRLQTQSSPCDIYGDDGRVFLPDFQFFLSTSVPYMNVVYYQTTLYKICAIL